MKTKFLAYDVNSDGFRREIGIFNSIEVFKACMRITFSRSNKEIKFVDKPKMIGCHGATVCTAIIDGEDDTFLDSIQYFEEADHL